jgi:hypothetical protein
MPDSLMSLAFFLAFIEKYDTKKNSVPKSNLFFDYISLALNRLVIELNYYVLLTIEKSKTSNQ